MMFKICLEDPSHGAWQICFSSHWLLYPSLESNRPSMLGFYKAMLPAGFVFKSECFYLSVHLFRTLSKVQFNSHSELEPDTFCTTTLITEKIHSNRTYQYPNPQAVTHPVTNTGQHCLTNFISQPALFALYHDHKSQTKVKLVALVKIITLSSLIQNQFCTV